MTTASGRNYEYDLVVIGGGSGGLAAAKEAAKCKPGLKVAVFDYVVPTIHGTKWGLGGTCVNVGCIPKKLMHYSAVLGHAIEDANEFGWSVDRQTATHDWAKMSGLIIDYIRSLNFAYRTGLTSAHVEYINGHCQFLDPHTIQWKGQAGKSGTVTAERVILSVGGRPSMGKVPGTELCISSDDIFWKKANPGKTLVIGAGYIALECAGFLNGLGNDVTVMVRDKFMRKFDEQCAGQIGELMERRGIRFLLPASCTAFKAARPAAVPDDAEMLADGSRRWKEGGKEHVVFPSGAKKVGDVLQPGPVIVSYRDARDPSRELTEEFDTVLLATGRDACIENLGLDKAGVRVHNRKILVDADEATSVPHIFAVGDATTGLPSLQHDASLAVDRPELTPVAIQAGQLLSRRLYLAGGGPQMRYHVVPTTVFTPDEYGFVGLSQEEAARPVAAGGVGAENVEVWVSRFGNLEISPTHPHPKPTASKVHTGQNLWLRKYCERHNLWWPIVCFDKGDTVLLHGHQGTVVDTTSGPAGELQYAVAVGDKTAAVASGLLELTPDKELERAEVFVKANCLAKLVCDKSRNNRVVGFHFIGPNAGEVTQGFALALSLGATKQDFDSMVGIHPTAAEEFAVLTTTVASGKSFLKPAGCGGGSCG